jgi:hypothetical protein
VSKTRPQYSADAYFVSPFDKKKENPTSFESTLNYNTLGSQPATPSAPAAAPTGLGKTASTGGPTIDTSFWNNLSNANQADSAAAAATSPGTTPPATGGKAMGSADWAGIGLQLIGAAVQDRQAEKQRQRDAESHRCRHECRHFRRQRVVIVSSACRQMSSFFRTCEHASH